jgi:large subunit ribosomal protein L17
MARRKFGRATNQRKALFKGLANSLILHEKIVTTEPKAKAVRPILERLITKAKVGGIHERREVEQVLGNPNSVRKMFDLVGPAFRDRAGGYLRITKMGNRVGDSARLAKIEFVAEIKAIEPKKETAAAPKEEKKTTKKEAPKTRASKAKADGKESKTSKK